MQRAGSYWLTAASITALVAILAVGGWLSARSIHLYASSFGTGPLDLLALETIPAELLKGHVTGIVPSLHYSLPMVLYLIPLHAADLDPLLMLRVHAFVEPAMLGGAVLLLTYVLFSAGSFAFRMVVVLLVAASNLLAAELGRWGAPNYVALYYVAAQTFSLIGIASLLRHRALPASLAFALSVACHPIIGGIGCIFGAAAMLADYRRYLTRETALAAIAFVILVSVWFHVTGLFTSLFGNPVDEQLWFDINRFGSYHLFPLDLGAFTFHSHPYFAPFLACVLLGFLYLPTAVAEFGLRRQVLFGIVALLCATAFGVIASAAPLPSGVVKLALHRASDLALIVCGMIAIRGLWMEITRGRSWLSVLAAGTLVSPFFFYGFPLVLALLLAFDRLVRVRASDLRDPWVVTLGAIALGAMVWLAFQFQSLAFNDVLDRYAGRQELLWAFAIAAGVLVTARLLPFARATVVGTVAAAAVIGLSLTWFRSQLAESRFGPDATGYYEAQLWAARNTPPGSLFLVDPTHHYGWLAFSRRPTFGNVRDWIVWTTTYSYDPQAFQEGVRRLSEFGLDYRNFLGRSPPVSGSEALIAAVGERFHAMSSADLRQLAAKYGVKYVLYFRRKLKGPPENATAVYENKDVLIISLN